MEVREMLSAPASATRWTPSGRTARRTSSEAAQCGGRNRHGGNASCSRSTGRSPSPSG